MLRRASVLTASLLMLTAASACSLGQSDAGKQPTSPPSQPADPALQVSNPKNLTGVTDSCQLLTPQQLTELGAADPEIEPYVNEQYKEPSCDISSDAFDITVDINTEHGGMTAAHARKDNFENFAPTEVGEYPAVQVNFQGTVCTVATGISDDQSVEVFYAKNSGGTPEMDDPCGYAKKISAEAIKNIPAA